MAVNASHQFTAEGTSQDLLNSLKEAGRARGREVFAIIRPMVNAAADEVEDDFEFWLQNWERAALSIWENEPHDQPVSADTWLKHVHQAHVAWMEETALLVAVGA